MKPSTWREGSLTVAAIAMWAWKSIGSFIVAGDRLPCAEVIRDYVSRRLRP
ncbi:MAG TPA: hypothetical protein VLR50_09790 [Desulfobacterales bacterium]|nr:hypothetical protein [Desulfobacterales bacterium]